MLSQIKTRIPLAAKISYWRVRKNIARLSYSARTREKYDAELAYWRRDLELLLQWYEGCRSDWHGIPAPKANQKYTCSEIPAVNAILTVHKIYPRYFDRLKLSRRSFVGKRVLEIGCGPLAPILVFEGCERHGLDPLIYKFTEIGWPLFALDVTFTNGYGENMPYPDGFFDALISCNALDHVDDFYKVASDAYRVLKKGGRLCLEVDYHAPTVTEPLKLYDELVLEAFSRCRMNKVCERGRAEVNQDGGFADVGMSESKLVLWHGIK